VMAFEVDPENPAKVIAPSTRRDEIGDAERAVSRMQLSLAEQLRQKQHLAALGLAVSKVSHDLRNMLASAQLLSDRMTETGDPQVQRFAPKLISTLGRAIAFCQATLSYGKASETPPQKRRFRLRDLVDEAAELAGALPVGEPDAGPQARAGEGRQAIFTNRVPHSLHLTADPDQMARVFGNLMRNAVQVMESAGTAAPRLEVSATLAGVMLNIDVSDNGPGVPTRAKEHLFEAFTGSVRAGGTGLGLAIASELVRLHAGTLTLVPEGEGATFRISLPSHEA
jgi:signal transduction histidine kinase